MSLLTPRPPPPPSPPPDVECRRGRRLTEQPLSSVLGALQLGHINVLLDEQEVAIFQPRAKLVSVFVQAVSTYISC